MARWEWVGEMQSGLKCLNPSFPSLVVGAKISPPPPMWDRKDLGRSKQGRAGKARQGGVKLSSLVTTYHLKFVVKVI